MWKPLVHMVGTKPSDNAQPIFNTHKVLSNLPNYLKDFKKKDELDSTSQYFPNQQTNQEVSQLNEDEDMNFSDGEEL